LENKVPPQKSIGARKAKEEKEAKKKIVDEVLKFNLRMQALRMRSIWNLKAPIRKTKFRHKSHCLLRHL
jgi:hypothetical protein